MSDSFCVLANTLITYIPYTVLHYVIPIICIYLYITPPLYPRIQIWFIYDVSFSLAVILPCHVDVDFNHKSMVTVV